MPGGQVCRLSKTPGNPDYRGSADHRKLQQCLTCTRLASRGAGSLLALVEVAPIAPHFRSAGRKPHARTVQISDGFDDAPKLNTVGLVMVGLPVHSISRHELGLTESQ